MEDGLVELIGHMYNSKNNIMKYYKVMKKNILKIKKMLLILLII
jgi:hypothetical protein